MDRTPGARQSHVLNFSNPPPPNLPIFNHLVPPPTIPPTPVPAAPSFFTSANFQPVPLSAPPPPNLPSHMALVKDEEILFEDKTASLQYQLNREDMELSFIGLEYVVEVVLKQMVGRTTNYDRWYSCRLCDVMYQTEKGQLGLSETKIKDHLTKTSHKLSYLIKHFPTVKEKKLEPPLNVCTLEGIDKIVRKVEKRFGRMKIRVVNGADIFRANLVSIDNVINNGKHQEEDEDFIADVLNRPVRLTPTEAGMRIKKRSRSQSNKSEKGRVKSGCEDSVTDRRKISPEKRKPSPEGKKSSKAESKYSPEKRTSSVRKRSNSNDRRPVKKNKKSCDRSPLPDKNTSNLESSNKEIYDKSKKLYKSDERKNKEKSSRKESPDSYKKSRITHKDRYSSSDDSRERSKKRKESVEKLKKSRDRIKKSPKTSDRKSRKRSKSSERNKKGGKRVKEDSSDQHKVIKRTKRKTDSSSEDSRERTSADPKAQKKRKKKKAKKRETSTDESSSASELEARKTKHKKGQIGKNQENIDQVSSGKKHVKPIASELVIAEKSSPDIIVLSDGEESASSKLNASKDSEIRSNKPNRRDNPSAVEDRDHDKKMKIYMDEEAELIKLMETKKSRYYDNPGMHPLYQQEWEMFWKNKVEQLRSQGVDAEKYDMTPEWIVTWRKFFDSDHLQQVELEVDRLRRKHRVLEGELEDWRKGRSRKRGISPWEVEERENQASTSTKDRGLRVKQGEDEEVSVLATLNLLVSLESKGALGQGMGEELSELRTTALNMEGDKFGSSNSQLVNSAKCHSMLVRARERLKLRLGNNTIRADQSAVARIAVENLGLLVAQSSCETEEVLEIETAPKVNYDTNKVKLDLAERLSRQLVGSGRQLSQQEFAALVEAEYVRLKHRLPGGQGVGSQGVAGHGLGGQGYQSAGWAGLQIIGGVMGQGVQGMIGQGSQGVVGQGLQEVVGQGLQGVGDQGLQRVVGQVFQGEADHGLQNSGLSNVSHSGDLPPSGSLFSAYPAASAPQNINWTALSEIVGSVKQGGEVVADQGGEVVADPEDTQVGSPMLEASHVGRPMLEDSQVGSPMLEVLTEQELMELVKNFKTLDKDDQMELIAYMKKLEQKDPERVKRLKKGLLTQH